MHIKMGYNITTFKNAFPHKMAKFSNVKLKLLLHQPNIFLSVFKIKLKSKF